MVLIFTEYGIKKVLFLDVPELYKPWVLLPGPQFNKKMSSYQCNQYRKSHCGDKTILRPS